MKCPRCQEGNFFLGNPYQLSSMGIVKKHCSHCNQKFELETGFYQGSYDVPYGLGVALCVVVVLNYLIRDHITPTALMVSFSITLVVLLPIIYTLSKIIRAALFIKYDKHAVTNFQIYQGNDSRIKG